jgi:hypothetical protein
MTRGVGRRRRRGREGEGGDEEVLRDEVAAYWNDIHYWNNTENTEKRYHLIHQVHGNPVSIQSNPTNSIINHQVLTRNIAISYHSP